MASRTSIRAAVLAALIVVSWLIPHATAIAGDMMINDAPTQTIRVAASDIGSRSVELGVSKSVVIDLPRDIKDVLVADPKIANAVVRSSRRAYIIGITMGQTNVFFFDAEGKQMAGFDIAVTRNLNGIRTAIGRYSRMPISRSKASAMASSWPAPRPAKPKRSRPSILRTGFSVPRLRIQPRKDPKSSTPSSCADAIKSC